MTALVNPYFPKDTSTEQDLFNRLKIQAIQCMGRTYHYIPRHVVNENPILGEDILSKFPLAIPIEMYMQDVLGFQGDKEMFSKFGLQIQNSYKLIVSQDRWEQEVKQYFDGVDTLLVPAVPDDILTPLVDESVPEVPANQEASFDVINNMRPQEGDLIYDPLTKFLMEVKFCDHDSEFFQLGKNYLYTLSCEAFQYASEEFNTGVTAIDSINELSMDLLGWQILQENGDLLLQEDCDYSLIQEVAGVDDTSPTKREYGEVFTGNSNTVVENPFGVFA